MRLTFHRPDTLFGRLMLILLIGLFSTQLVTLLLHLQERAHWLDMAATHTAAMHASHADGLPARFLLHLGLTLLAVVGLALLAVRAVTRPLQQLADAATAFAHDLDAAPLALHGPAEVRRATEAFNFMQQRLRGLVQDRSRALVAVSHDLRTPLTRLRLRAELIEDQRLQSQINADIALMQTMTDSVLAYLRGLQDSEPMQRLDLAALLDSLVQDEQAVGRPVQLRMPLPSSAICAARLITLRRALTNLIDNAVQHGTSPSAWVSLQACAEDASWHISVEDDGPGIPEADLVRVTEPFVRLDAARNLSTGGVGLGLAIVRDAAQRHGGRLALTNRPEGGLRATLVLPMA